MFSRFPKVWNIWIYSFSKPHIFLIKHYQCLKCIFNYIGVCSILHKHFLCFFAFYFKKTNLQKLQERLKVYRQRTLIVFQMSWTSQIQNVISQISWLLPKNVDLETIHWMLSDFYSLQRANSEFYWTWWQAKVWWAQAKKTKFKTISTTFLVSRTIVSILFRISKHYRHWWNACEKQVHKLRRTSELNLE